MQKKHFVMLGIILFASSIFPWNVLAYDDHYEEHHPNPPTPNWTKEKEHSNAYQEKGTPNKKKTAKRKP